jgi:hypothetical protein
MTKEQILEKIQIPDGRCITYGGKTYSSTEIDPNSLASYLATLEERLEKVEGKKCRDLECCCESHTTPTECEHKHRGLYGECLKCTEKLDDSPTEEHEEVQTPKRKLNLIPNPKDAPPEKDCKYETGGVKFYHSEVKDWEIRFDEHMDAHKAFDPHQREIAKDFIRNLLK